MNTKILTEVFSETLDEHPEYLALFDEIVQKHMAGLPLDDSVRWLDLSVAQIIQIFKEHGISISPYVALSMLYLLSNSVYR